MLTSSGCFGHTHIGKVRQDNEDRFLVDFWPNRSAVLAVIADGMGAYGGGATAAATVIETFAQLTHRELPPSRSERYELLLSAFYRADDRVRELQASTYPEMGATVAAAIITGNELLHLYSGDCRVYHFAKGEAIYVSRDHSVVRALVEAGMINETEAAVHPMRNIVTSCLGGPTTKLRLTVDPQLGGSELPEIPSEGPFRLLSTGDVIVMCSDGLWSGLDGNVLANTVRRSRSSRMDAKELSNLLVELALSGPAADNITGVVLDADSLSADFERIIRQGEL